MARKKKLNVKDSDKGEDIGEESEDESPPESNVYTVVVDSHTHEGVAYNSGDPIVLDFPPTVRKLKARGIIS